MTTAPGAPDPDEERLRDLEARLAGWDPKARAEAMRHLSAAEEQLVQAWYCNRGRKCDGKPHGKYGWKHARGSQWPPPGEDWFVWAILAGRGFGKTRSGAEYTRKMSEKVGRMALIAPTATDARDTMVEGESGLIAVCERAGMKALYEPAKRRFTFPSGSRATLFSGEEPNRLRGPQHGFAWLDEPAHMPFIDEVWSNLLFGLRLPPRPHVIVTTTPTPKPWVVKTVKDPRTRVTRGSTHENLDNLADEYRNVIAGYEGTRLGRQELYGEILEDVEGAMWRADIITYDQTYGPEDMDRIVVAIDPAGTANRRSDETGILVVGVRRKAIELFGQRVDMGYVLADRSGKYSPHDWAKAGIAAYDDFHADGLVVEVNFGADMVEDNMRHYGFEGHLIKSRASRGKELRAEPIVGLYEQYRVKHVAPGFNPEGPLGKLETEMLTWVPGEGASPNRVDALVWGLTELLKPGGEITIVSPRSLIPPSNDFGIPEDGGTARFGRDWYDTYGRDAG